ncbi:hypothetical protein EAG_08721 [Camponotus floridanus]|uniref:Uncharacterized protein n=1 Tax=Camponotus floridanus TaxID=104421 RepID=E2A831_CAMFO|nr:hypothetical protein EAG_08721 [Camponotus floridanus]
MLSDSVYNYATTRRGAADQDSDSQYEAQAQLQITSSIQSKPRNKRKNFKPISSRMAEVSDESDKDDDEPEVVEESSSEILEYERKTMLLPAEDRSKQRLNNNEVSPMDLSVATRPPSSEADDDSADSLRHKFILEQLRSRKLYSPGTEARSPNSDSSERSGSGVLDAESSRLDDQDTQFEDERGNEADGEAEIEERKPFEGMREYAESTMQELLAIYGLAGGELAKSVSRQLPPTFLNPSVGQQTQANSTAIQRICRICWSGLIRDALVARGKKRGIGDIEEERGKTNGREKGERVQISLVTSFYLARARMSWGTMVPKTNRREIEIGASSLSGDKEAQQLHA